MWSLCNVIVPTAVESHVANATLLAEWGIEGFCCDSSVGSRYARPPYVICVDVSVLIARIYFSADVKKPESLDSGFLQFEAW